MNVICKYAYNRKGQPIGCVVAIGAGILGVAKLHKEDLKGAKKSDTRKLAIGRALDFKNGKLSYFKVDKEGKSIELKTGISIIGTNEPKQSYNVSGCLLKIFDEMIQRSNRYFKEIGD